MAKTRTTPVPKRVYVMSGGPWALRKVALSEIAYNETLTFTVNGKKGSYVKTEWREAK